MTKTQKVRHALNAGMSVAQATAFVGCDPALTRRVKRQLEAEQGKPLSIPQFVPDKPIRTNKARLVFNGEPVLAKEIFDYIKQNPGWTPQELGQLLASEKHNADTIQATISALVRAKMVAKDPGTRQLTALVVRYKSPYSELRRRGVKPAYHKQPKAQQKVSAPAVVSTIKPSPQPTLWTRVKNFLWG